jgi:anaerobic ribonucleoside-triphosphate reductase activating protein
MKLQVNRIAYPVTVLGPGRRLGLWVQGCHIHCPGCGSTDTWNPTSGQTSETETLANELADLIIEHELTGLTITGGEPTEQAAALSDLVSRVQEALQNSGAASIDVLVFTGLTTEAASRRAANLWQVLDAAVCGPYRPNRPSTAALIASANQELVTLTPLGDTRFADLDNEPNQSLQAHISASEITLIGLPNPGDLPRLEDALRQRGITMGGRSWQTQ